ncbi:DUF3857 domain-containing protein [Sphingomonas astaxanthinifaciens]|nr:DUF3857 domain-containing protein [Sphingomonas astaxanthinifaciens]
MMRSFGGSMAAAVLVMPAAAHAADPTPSIRPAPAWVVPVKVPTPNPKLLALPAQVLVLNVQERLAREATTTYLEYVAQPQTVTGLQGIGTVAMPWNVERSDFAIHKIEINRAGKVINALDPAAMMVLRQETNLDKAMLDGGRTVVLPVKGLQLGDRLTVAVSYTTKAPVIAVRPEEVWMVNADETINRTERRLIVPDDLAVKWYRAPATAEPTVTKAGGYTDYFFVGSGAKAREWPTGTPSRFTAPLVQVTAWSNWNEVATAVIPLFAKARTIKDGSPLAAEADRIAAASKDPEQRLLAALRLAQEKVRYVALLLGQGAYVPVGAEETWEQKFGDCKGKTALLLGLLDRLGIEAEPMLVSSSLNSYMPELHPSLAVFDHVMVRARVNGRTLYLDPTSYGQRTVSELSRSAFVRGLPLVPGTDLISIARTIPAQALSQADVVWDGRQGFERRVPFTATLVLRDETASQMRAAKAASEDADKHLENLQNFVPGVANKDLALKSEEPEQPDGSYKVTFAGTATMDWSPIKGLKGYRYELSQNTVKWEFEDGRSGDKDRDLPLVMNWPYYIASSETILLPNGGKGFKAEGEQIDRRFGAVRITRSIGIEGDKAVTRAVFVHEKPEASAEETRSMKKVADELNDKFAYVVAPGKIRPVKDEEGKKD